MTELDLFVLVLLVSIIGWISFIDIRFLRIPNALNLALFLLGISYMLVSEAGNTGAQIMFAALIFAVLFSIRHFHFKITGRIGLGLGDVKMGGAAAVWIHPALFPTLLLVASAAALVLAFGAKLISQEPDEPAMQIPFGPFIGIALILVWLLQISNFTDTGIFG